MRDNWNRLLQFTQDFVSRFILSSDCAQIAILSFGNNAYVTSYLNSDLDLASLNSAIASMRFRDERTHTGDVFRKMTQEIFQQKNGDRTGVQNLGLLFIDGPANVNNATTAKFAEEARKSGIKIITVGIENQIDRGELLQITQDSRKNLEFGSFLDLDKDETKVYIFNKL